MKTVENVLNELGRLTMDGLVNTLVDADITGVPLDPCCCPLAEYIAQQTGEAVEVLACWVHKGDGGLLPLRGHLTAFILDFDAGRWPQLLREGYDPLWD
jgi:hypothetical protein